MSIRQVYAFDATSQAARSLLSDLEQLGLQIAPPYSGEVGGPEQIFVADPVAMEKPAGMAAIRQALDNGCCVLLDSQKFAAVLNEIKLAGDISEETRKTLHVYALYKCIESDARRLAAMQDSLPAYMAAACEKVLDLRYGENWHQRAALYRRADGLGIYDAAKLNGREMSYNNIVDAETVLEMLIDLSFYNGSRVDSALSVIVKHANPCGAAYGHDLEEAYRASFATDPKSAFGGVFGFNRPIDVDTAKAIGDSFVEVLLAPGFDSQALRILCHNKPNRRILDIKDLLSRKDELYRGYSIKGIFGGCLAQDYDTGDVKDWKVVTKRQPSDSEVRALRFAWKVAKYVKSNALVYATEDRTIGIGSGQVSRVDSARFGAEKAEEHGLSTRGTVAATDSFFPFRDGLEETYRAGATAVVHPGGSIRDADVIQAADEYGMAMVFTGMRHFRH